MNTSFGFNQNDHKWVDSGKIVNRLVDIVSKGGNYLLNVGPTPEGLIPQPSIDHLMEVGAWMDMPMCWANGYRGLWQVGFDSSGLRELDRHRDRQLRRIRNCLRHPEKRLTRS